MTLPRLRIDAASDVPPFEQVRRHVVDLVASGRLAVGERLPPVRTYAAELGVAAGTVAKAYKELEAAGVVVTATRAGTRIAPGAAAPAGAAPDLQRAAAAYVERCRRLGVSDAAALGAVQAALR